MSLADQIGALAGEADGLSHRNWRRTGLTLAKVTNIKDDETFNRVKCLPIGADEKEETDWCYVMTPMGGPERGLFLFPQVEDLVVLAYLDDDPHRPLVLGGFWNTKVKPPFPVQDGKAEDYCLKTPNQVNITIHDEKEKQTLTAAMPSGTVFTLDDGEKRITLQDKDGENALTMDLDGGNVELKAKEKLTLSAGETTITLEKGGNITLKGKGKITAAADGDITAQGANIELKAKSKLAGQGASVEAKADTKLKMQAGMAELKSNANLDLNASAVATLKGTMVKIN